MFKQDGWRRKIFAHLLNTIASWQGSGGKYVAQFQGNLDALAKDLSVATGRWIKARYNNEHGCAEIFCPCDRTIAWVTVHGEMCLASTVHISLPFLPSQNLQELFRQHLQRPRWGDAPKAGMEICFHAFA